MKKIVIAISFLTLLSMATKTHGQSIEHAVLKAFVEALNQQNKEHLLQSKLSDVQVIEDPSTGEVNINYGSNSPAIRELKSLSKDKQLRILSLPDLPIFPVQQKIELIDTNNLLTHGLEVKTNSNIIIVTTKKKSDSATGITLEKIGFRESEILVWVSFANKDTLNIYSFKWDRNNLIFTSFSRIPRKPSYE